MGYKINEYGEIITPKKATQNNSVSNKNIRRKSWFARDYNWLWVIGLLIQIGFIISALSCSIYQDSYYQYDYETGYYIQHVFTAERSGMFTVFGCIILFVYMITWLWSKTKKNNFISNFIWMLLYSSIIYLSIYMIDYCKEQYQSIILVPCVFALSLWALVNSLSSFK